ncbi:lipoprotein-anchoring transpeptidase ErfK/SrfK [Clostridium tetanomorphum]|uniref:L,D-transpeptidase family protein n=1 Tax=Clostridium tetanomorphum TaxID=1553 RepID=A0A923J2R5_CLOTT|nr:L,D-transpeptidase family protein [Clostridium tetanomorphum]KAJ49003.1 hypothetical protein CTM_25409 [Clostridium tetanomorphum DSM 665]KAJ49537.1 hypothetical protein CTM_22586 [Clostridium tetanomorphum DSM 665]MBC2398948.1 L,D-transpeptidase family protein [Clostridium tetanomorphum]MBP1866362.1 lipoprotein-anchoring transpeptidase ErfK/SrfK [Clostridium tetanomorphum]NRS86539.1 lipoprotein-anchoring transpeptidase ErfK/SrfK [Clostridium tetanomorphum]
MKKKLNLIRLFLVVLICTVMLGSLSFRVYAADSVEDGQTVKEEKVNKVIIPVQENTILKNASMHFENSIIYQNDIIHYLINANYNGKINYRVFLHHLDSDSWKDITPGYTLDRNGRELYQANLLKLTPGKYEIIVFAKKAESQGEKNIKIKEYDVKYDDYKIEQFQCVENIDPQLDASIQGKSPLYEGSIEQITLKSNGFDGLVQYNVLLYSNKTKQWKSITNGYTKAINAKEVYKISTDKLSADSYTLSVRVKKAGYKGSKLDSLGDYDNLKNFTMSVIKKPKPKPKSSEPEAPKIQPIYVGNDNENSKINIRRDSSLNSPVVGQIYGSTQGIKVLGKKGNFYYVQAKDYDTLRNVKGYIRQDYVKQVTPSNIYSIIVDISDQKVYIYKYGKLVQKFICSTGMDATPTPTGTYLIGGRGPSFGQEKGYICYNFVRINHDYLFHSVLHYLDGSIIQSEYNKLGRKASHGCIRLKDENIKWIYNNIPRNTLVVIQQ